MLQSARNDSGEVTFTLKVAADSGIQRELDKIKAAALKTQSEIHQGWSKAFSGIGPVGGGAFQTSPGGIPRSGPSAGSIAAMNQRLANPSVAEMVREHKKAQDEMRRSVIDNIKASQAAREAADQTLSQNYQRRAAERAAQIKAEAAARESAEVSHRLSIAKTAAMQLAATGQAINGFRQLGSGVSSVMRSFALLGMANGDDLEKSVRQFAQLESSIQLAGGAVNAGQGAARMLGGLARMHPALAVGAVGLTAVGGYAAFNSNHQSRWDVAEEQAEMERRRSSQRMLAGSEAARNLAFPGEMALQSAERATWRGRAGRFAEAESGIAAMRAGAWTDADAAKERWSSAARYNMSLKSHQTPIGDEQMGVMENEYNQARLRGASISTEADRQSLRLKQQQLDTIREQESAIRRFVEIQNNADQRHLSMLREHSSVVNSRLEMARRANDDAQVVFGNMRPGERARITDIAKRAQAGELINRRDRDFGAVMPGLQPYLDESARREARNAPGFLHGPIHNLNGDVIDELQPKAKNAQFIASQFAEVAAVNAAAREQQLQALFKPKFEEMETNIAKAVANVFKSVNFEAKLRDEIKAAKSVSGAAGGR